MRCAVKTYVSQTFCLFDLLNLVASVSIAAPRQRVMLPILLFFFLLGAVTLIRILYVIRCSRSGCSHQKRNGSARTLVILGSGGHTAEMICLLNELNRDLYSPRFYVLASSDTTSQSKVSAIEAASEEGKSYEIFRINRSRHVGQSYLSAILTTIFSILQCVPLVYRLRPDLILCNGPGTCVPICLIAFLFKVLFINTQCRIVFIESYCRVKTISLSGKILIWFVDCFVVQWPQLVASARSNVQYFGRLT